MKEAQRCWERLPPPSTHETMLSEGLGFRVQGLVGGDRSDDKMVLFFLLAKPDVYHLWFRVCGVSVCGLRFRACGLGFRV